MFLKSFCGVYPDWLQSQSVETHCVKADNICESSDFLFGSNVDIIIASCRYFYCRINRLSSTFKYKDLSMAVHAKMGASVYLL